PRFSLGVPHHPSVASLPVRAERVRTSGGTPTTIRAAPGHAARSERPATKPDGRPAANARASLRRTSMTLPYANQGMTNTHSFAPGHRRLQNEIHDAMTPNSSANTGAIGG